MNDLDLAPVMLESGEAIFTGQSNSQPGCQDVCPEEATVMVPCPGLRGRPVPVHLLQTIGRITRIILISCTFLIAVVAIQRNWSHQKAQWGCTGVTPLAQEAYCQQDFVIKAHILATFPSRDGNYNYRVLVKKIYKVLDKREFRRGKAAYITHLGPFFYQDILKTNVSYVMTGRIMKYHSRRELTSCSWIREVSKMTAVQRRGFRRHYKKNCRCSIKRRTLDHTYDSCYLSLHPVEMKCRDDFSVCRYDKELRVCHFDHPVNYDTCKNLRFTHSKYGYD